MVETHDASIAGSNSCGAGAVLLPPRLSGSSVAMVWRPLTSISWRRVPSIERALAVMVMVVFLYAGDFHGCTTVRLSRICILILLFFFFFLYFIFFFFFPPVPPPLPEPMIELVAQRFRVL